MWTVGSVEICYNFLRAIPFVGCTGSTIVISVEIQISASSLNSCLIFFALTFAQMALWKAYRLNSKLDLPL